MPSSSRKRFSKKGERLEEVKESINVKAEARIICELALLPLFHFMENSASNSLPFTVTTRRHGIRTNAPEPAQSETIYRLRK